jgi:Cu(I)/Ag(I) efflux system membrane protein CusA/SilA
MNESVLTLLPREDWPPIPVARWYQDWAPDWLARLLRPVWPDQRPRTLSELTRDLDQALQMPGYQMAISPPIRTRIDMLTTGVRTPVGIKVFGPDLPGIEQVSLQLEGLLRAVRGTRSTFAERQTGREYIDVVPDREAIARYGLSVRDVQNVVEAAIGGMPVSTVVAGRARYSVNVRYAADFRADPDALRSILVPVPAGQAVALGEEVSPGRGSAAVASAEMRPVRGSAGAGMAGGSGMGGESGMDGSASMGDTDGMGGPSRPSADSLERWQQSGSAVPLGALAAVHVVTGPPMIKDENGVLVGYVFADIDAAQRDLGGWVKEAKQLVQAQLVLPPGYRLQWTGQYEFMADMEARLRVVLPLTLVLIVGLLYLSLRGWAQTWLVLLSLPFAIAGSIWLLALLQYNLSTAVWVGLIAVGGVAAQTGIVVVLYLDQAFREALTQGRMQIGEDVDRAVVEGAAKCLRPMLMTVATTVLGLMPLLFESGVGADLSARTAAPVVGGLWSSMFLTLLVLPAAYAMWRRWQLVHGRLSLPAAT